MDVRVSVVSSNRRDGLESLDDWLQAEPALSGKATPSRPVPQEGELGSLADALVVSVGSGGALSILAASLHAWLSQPRRSDVRLRLRGDNGRVVEMSADRVGARNFEAMIREAFEFGKSGD
jgi:Effector Associated Constant Component 1